MILENIIAGVYSDWFFNVFMTKATLAIKNNLALLLFISFYFVKFSRWTKNKWDDRASNWLMQKLTRKNRSEV